MNFILETDKFARQLEAWKKGHGFSDRDALQNMAEIWDTFKNIPERKKVIYGSVTSSPPKTDLSCGSCVQDMLQMVYNWRTICENEVTIYFTGVPQAEVIEAKMSFDNPQTFPEVDCNFEATNNSNTNEELYGKDNIKEVQVIPNPMYVGQYSGLKMHQLRSLAKKKGIVYTNKTTSKELIELLNNKDNG